MSEPLTVTVAPLWRRLVAALVDLVPTFGLALLAAWLLVALDPEPPAIPPWNFFDRVVDYVQARPERTMLAFVAACVIQILWCFIPTLKWQATPGKRLLGLRVIDGDGRKPRAGRLLGWAALRLGSAFLAGAGLWWAIVDPTRRTLHDRFARVWVVRDDATSRRSAS